MRNSKLGANCPGANCCGGELSVFHTGRTVTDLRSRLVPETDQNILLIHYNVLLTLMDLAEKI
uniref:Uncharacterized protein n=1 Tax=Romanomermis culicivorax TaxID=13658 RepID=A0A915IJ51_ROMCU